jgi:hypothetical protein
LVGLPWQRAGNRKSYEEEASRKEDNYDRRSEAKAGRVRSRGVSKYADHVVLAVQTGSPDAG